MRTYHVYIVASRTRRLYIGVTGSLSRRIAQHRRLSEGFSATYRVTRLVYVEASSDVRAAIAREKQLKGWTRAKKLALIASLNPGWDDLAEGWGDSG
jgi:putative endonuclease